MLPDFQAAFLRPFPPPHKYCWAAGPQPTRALLGNKFNSMKRPSKLFWNDFAKIILSSIVQLSQNVPHDKALVAVTVYGHNNHYRDGAVGWSRLAETKENGPRAPGAPYDARRGCEGECESQGTTKKRVWWTRIAPGA